MLKKTTTIFLLLLLLLGLSVLLYPTVSNFWNQRHASQAVTYYEETADQLTLKEYAKMRQSAQDYNNSLAEDGQSFVLGDKQKEVYQNQLALDANGMMGYIVIPKIHVELPIYHGTEEAVLQIGVGHLEWTSLPVGGKGSHTVLSGHRGLPRAELFTNLDKLVPGDEFYLRVLNQTFTYQVYQIETVEPDQLGSLTIEAGKDLCTLVTCTPYGINTHRLLVHGVRVESQS